MKFKEALKGEITSDDKRMFKDRSVDEAWEKLILSILSALRKSAVNPANTHLSNHGLHQKR